MTTPIIITRKRPLPFFRPETQNQLKVEFRFTMSEFGMYKIEVCATADSYSEHASARMCKLQSVSVHTAARSLPRALEFASAQLGEVLGDIAEQYEYEQLLQFAREESAAEAATQSETPEPGGG